MVLTRAILQEMMLPTTLEVDSIRDVLNNRITSAAGFGIREMKTTMSNLKALVGDLDQHTVPQSKVAAATRIVLVEYLDNKIDVKLSDNWEGETRPLDPTNASEDLEDDRLTIHISWGPK